MTKRPLPFLRVAPSIHHHPMFLTSGRRAKEAFLALLSISGTRGLGGHFEAQDWAPRVLAMEWAPSEPEDWDGLEASMKTGVEALSRVDGVHLDEDGSLTIVKWKDWYGEDAMKTRGEKPADPEAVREAARIRKQLERQRKREPTLPVDVTDVTDVTTQEEKRGEETKNPQSPLPPPPLEPNMPAATDAHPPAPSPTARGSQTGMPSVQGNRRVPSLALAHVAKASPAPKLMAAPVQPVTEADAIFAYSQEHNPAEAKAMSPKLRQDLDSCLVLFGAEQVRLAIQAANRPGACGVRQLRGGRTEVRVVTAREKQLSRIAVHLLRTNATPPVTPVPGGICQACDESPPVVKMAGAATPAEMAWAHVVGVLARDGVPLGASRLASLQARALGDDYLDVEVSDRWQGEGFTHNYSTRLMAAMLELPAGPYGLRFVAPDGQLSLAVKKPGFFTDGPDFHGQ